MSKKTNYMEFKKGAQITTSDFWYDLFQGGYIKPDKLLKNPEEAKKVAEAMETIKQFQEAAEAKDIIDYL